MFSRVTQVSSNNFRARRAHPSGAGLQARVTSRASSSPCGERGVPPLFPLKCCLKGTRKLEAQEAVGLAAFFEQCLTVRVWGGGLPTVAEAVLTKQALGAERGSGN
jgi:hypothetical protein